MTNLEYYNIPTEKQANNQPKNKRISWK